MPPSQPFLERIQFFFTRSIWMAGALSDRSLRGRLLALLRIAATTVAGVVENALPSRAGALSYSSMLALGPLVILVVLFTGSIADKHTESDYLLAQINRALLFVAPQLAQLAPPTADPPSAPEAAPGAPTAVVTALNPQLEALLRGLLDPSHTKAIGAIGIISLIVIVIQLFTSIENAFNGIWGVRRGRGWMLRIVYYWAALTLGAVLALAAFAALSASAFFSLVDSLPFAPQFRAAAPLATPLVSALVLIALLAVFYKFIPNTSVGWFPAACGATVVVALIHLNNTLAFLYIRSVSLNLSIYGGLAALVVLMLGLYVFWLILLLGGQITYAVQNAHYRGAAVAWADLNHCARIGLAVLVLAIVARRFKACGRPFTAAQIAEIARLPLQVLNACFQRLISLGMISRLPPENTIGDLDDRFQPARPLDSITLAEFKELFESAGEGPTPDTIGALDPVAQIFFEKNRAAVAQALGSETLEELITRLHAPCPTD